MFKKRDSQSYPKYDPRSPLPNYIPEVSWTDKGEPIIAREELHKASPIPRNLTIIIIILAALSFAYNAVQQFQRNDDLKRANNKLATQVEDNRKLVLGLQVQQGIIDQNEQRLEDLVLAISTAKTPGEVTAAIQRFLKESAAAHEQEKKNSQPKSSSSSPKPTSTQTASSASPKVSRSSRPSPTTPSSSSASPSPSGSSSVVCVDTPAGKVCVPPSSQAFYEAQSRQVYTEFSITELANYLFSRIWHLIITFAQVTLNYIH